LEYVATQIKAKTLIATHYHELIEMEKMYDWVKNYSVSVYETEKEVVFMKKIVEWWASKSYWLDVAKIAWIPAVILQRAGENLEELKETATQNTKNVSNQSLFSPNRFVQVSDPKFEKVKNIINSFDVNNITPLQALQLLAKIKDELK
jgi:DNA mismatch repair protein MutS